MAEDTGSLAARRNLAITLTGETEHANIWGYVRTDVQAVEISGS